MIAYRYVSLMLVLGLICLSSPTFAADEKPAEVKIVTGNPTILMKTSAGDLEIELFEDDAPNTVANFITLAEKKFYDNLTFHRIIKDFMIQGGDPKGNGMGGPGYKFPDEVKTNKQKNNQYALSMANAGPNTNGSQFFIVTAKEGTPHLNGLHTVFGKVVKGTEVVDKLEASPTVQTRPNPVVKIISVTVLSKRDHVYEVKGAVKE
jgi:peptidyl-prolyl cis-trans isomerase B (cyclophilin B)